MPATRKPAAGSWPRRAAAAAAVVAALLALVLLAKWLRTLPGVQEFVLQYPGYAPLPAQAPQGLPAWLGWQHFLNAFFLVLIVRSGWQVRTTTRPQGYWTRNNQGLLRTRNPPQKISLDLWFHLCLDALWVLNGAIFIVLLLATGQWMRIVPTSWDVVPNALSTALQYASLDWPVENGWVNYNALQLLAYFATVFIAAPLAILSGLRMSAAWPKDAAGLNRAFPMEAARAVHLPVMLYFVAFTAVHVFLVFATGALRNLNHMYAARDDGGWLGFWLFAASVAVMAAAWVLARPLFLRPVASLMGKVSR
ncbi:cytochrome b/b6 domain-containing protein [Arthrobacter sp. I2-34]|uniref:Cytochrome b/b6 domain-containing protein n=1 Tax=Arthrobacter hankyongi TaxID=2904801 RepID=A0ABS9L1K7_9MICC|nr:cytochrome b/b6 domain-containing protein [Arthrobacter hankyongi]MCG2620480.1 cytochrome b/b6 domain-containing protein [Arthrobacter hankyongi]